MDELKPCPFCGGKAGFSDNDTDDGEVEFILCGSCGVMNEYYLVDEEGSPNERFIERDKLIEAWNKRVKDNG